MLHSRTDTSTNRTGRYPSLEDDDDDASKKRRLAVVMVAAAVAIEYSRKQHRGPRFPIPRERRSVDSIFDELGPTYTRRAYRMTREGFLALHERLRPFITRVKQERSSPNGFIPSSIRLAAALRFFAGGSPYDLAIVHGISHSAVYESVWIVLDAINQHSDLRIRFPESHEEQRRIALEFKKKSSAGFDCCVGAIDGLLVWIEKPNPADCNLAHCGETKFFCGRKKKFGLNMMGTVDHVGRFLDVEIRHPGATSDYLCFETSSLKRKLLVHSFLAPGLVLFGDNAYVDTEYMVVPFKNPSIENGEDDFNFYHSQVRINVECAFGKLVHRWGILRRAISAKIGLQKTTALVMALCSLHNFCINQSLDPDEPLEADNAFNASQGGFEHNSNRNPIELIGGGEHFDDITRTLRRRQVPLTHRPKDFLHRSVVNQGLTRPRPMR